MNSVSKIAIIGTNSILGKNLLQFFIDANYHVFSFSRKITNQTLCQTKNVKYFDYNEIDTGIKDVDVIIISSFSRNLNGLDLVNSINFCEKIFKLAVINHIPYVVFLSSQSVYGTYRPIPSTENSVINPSDLYALAKYSCEKLINYYSASETKFISIRLSSLIGPEYKDRIVFKLLRSASTDSKITVYGGEQIFSYLDIRDAVLAIYNLIKKINTVHLNKVYNVGSNLCYSLDDIAEIIKTFFRDDLNKNICLSKRSYDIKTSICLDSTLFMTTFNWSIKYNLKESIKHIYQSIYYGYNT